MPSLADALGSISAHSKQIVELSAHNDRPCGPFTKAYLDPSVLTLIRDPQEREVRLFKFVGEESGGKRVEKRDGVVTPLKELKSKSNTQVEVMLRTALRLVDDYGPMPRARSHIKELIRAHDQQIARIAELEELIEEAKRPRPRPVETPASPQPVDVDKAIKAEEEAVKALESAVAGLRNDKARRSVSPDKASPVAKAPRWSVAVQTPGKTASHHISNSLVTGATPRRTTTSINRFSPLTLLTTPKANKGRKSVFGRTSIRPPVYLPKEKAPEIVEEVGDETIRLAAPLQATPPPAPPVEATPKPSPFKTPAPEPSSSSMMMGVNYDSEHVQVGLAKLQNTMPEMLQQGLTDGADAPRSAADVIRHLDKLAQSSPDPPPSPSSSSASTAPNSALRLTNQTILLAHLLLALLRSEDGSAVMNDLKEQLNGVARTKGWTDVSDMGTKVVYQAMGKRCLKIDRRGGGGGRVSFAT